MCVRNRERAACWSGFVPWSDFDRLLIGQPCRVSKDPLGSVPSHTHTHTLQRPFTALVWTTNWVSKWLAVKLHQMGCLLIWCWDKNVFFHKRRVSLTFLFPFSRFCTRARVVNEYGKLVYLCTFPQSLISPLPAHTIKLISHQGLCTVKRNSINVIKMIIFHKSLLQLLQRQRQMYLMMFLSSSDCLV